MPRCAGHCPSGGLVGRTAFKRDPARTAACPRPAGISASTAEIPRTRRAKGPAHVVSDRLVQRLRIRGGCRLLRRRLVLGRAKVLVDRAEAAELGASNLATGLATLL